VRDSTKPAGNPKRVAADTYLQKTPSLTLTTKAGLVMEFTVEQNPQYAEVADVIETNLRINAIRDFARLNLDKIMSGEPLTVRSADGQDEIIITDPETYTSRTKDAVRSLIQSLPDNYVVESTDGTYVALHTEYESTLRLTNAMQRQSATQAEIAQKWADFCGRIYRSAGSEAPIAPRSSQASPRRRAA
jgi:hypothetical protein